jgi:4-hydroxy-tetrahydrodipicolinate synthase
MTQLVDGILPPMVTPFNDDESIDEDGLSSEIRYMLARGVHGLCVGGSTGEGHTLSIEESCRITEIALEMQGRAAGIARHPILPVSEQGRAEIATALARAGIEAMAVA